MAFELIWPLLSKRFFIINPPYPCSKIYGDRAVIELCQYIIDAIPSDRSSLKRNNRNETPPTCFTNFKLWPYIPDPALPALLLLPGSSLSGG